MEEMLGRYLRKLRLPVEALEGGAAHLERLLRQHDFSAARA